MEKEPTRGSRQMWLGIALSVISLGAIFFFIRPQEILEALKVARYEYLLLTALGATAFLVLRAVRWRYLLQNDVPWLPVFHIQNVGYLLTYLLPLRLGDVARAVLIGNVPPVTIARGVSTMVVERILDMLFIVTLLPFTLANVEQVPEWMQAGARAFGAVAVVAIVVMVIGANQRAVARRLARLVLARLPFLDTERWVERVDHLLAGLDSLTRLRDSVILIALTIVTWLPIIFAYYAGLLAVNLEPTWSLAGFIVCAAALTVALPSSPGQVGVYHAGVIAALTVAGQPEAQAASFAFLYHGLNVIVFVIFGLIGIAGTGATLSNVIDSTRAFLRRGQTNEPVSPPR